MEGDHAEQESDGKTNGEVKASPTTTALEAVETVADAASTGCCLAEAATAVGILDCFVATAALPLAACSSASTTDGGGTLPQQFANGRFRAS